MKTKTKTVDDYISAFPANVRKRLQILRKNTLQVAPGAVEGLKWGMPSISYGRILVTYAAFKNHIGFYPTPSVIKKFAKEIKKYKSAKGSVQFPHDQPLPTTLIRNMTKYRVKEASTQDKKWKNNPKSSLLKS